MKNKKNNTSKINAPQSKSVDWEKRRKQMEATATLGLIIVAVGMIGPFAGGFELSTLAIYKWIYAAGALIFTFARIVGAGDKSESMRLRRLRRLEFWAGMAFCIAAFFWFYNEQRLSHMPYVGPLAILKDTVLFSLVGAAIQVVASWMIAWRQKKEAKK